jgi:hypothetical protein
MAECMTLMGSTPEAIAKTLAFLQIDLTDPDLHRHALAAARGTAFARWSAMRSNGPDRSGLATTGALALVVTPTAEVVLDGRTLGTMASALSC